MASDSENAKEWFGQKPEPVPGQMDLFGSPEAAESRSDGEAATERVRRNAARQKARSWKPASRPASTERPMSVAEAVQRIVDGKNGA